VSDRERFLEAVLFDTPDLIHYSRRLAELTGWL
jgi:hypothetical protein